MLPIRNTYHGLVLSVPGEIVDSLKIVELLRVLFISFKLVKIRLRKTLVCLHFRIVLHLIFFPLKRFEQNIVNKRSLIVVKMALYLTLLLYPI